MKSFATPDFWRAYAALPHAIRKQARKAYGLWQENQSHPSLHFKKVYQPDFTGSAVTTVLPHFTN